MKKTLALLAFAFLFLGANVEKTKKKTVRFDNGVTYQYSILKDSKVKTGPFTCKLNGQRIVEGEFLNNQKTGQWNIYDEKKLVFTVFFSADTIERVETTEHTLAYQNEVKVKVSLMARMHFAKNFRLNKVVDNMHPTLLLEFDSFGKPISSNLLAPLKDPEVELNILNLFKNFHGLPYMENGVLAGYKLSIPVSIILDKRK